jgi:hypothetical protein
MLFIIVMEVLNSLIKEPNTQSCHVHPLHSQALAHRALLYADELVVMLVPTTDDLNYLLGLWDW